MKYYLTLFNKDLPGVLSSKDIEEKLGLEEISKTHHCMIIDCSAKTGKNLLEGIDWICKDISSRIFTME